MPIYSIKCETCEQIIGIVDGNESVLNIAQSISALINKHKGSGCSAKGFYSEVNLQQSLEKSKCKNKSNE